MNEDDVMFVPEAKSALVSAVRNSAGRLATIPPLIVASWLLPLAHNLVVATTTDDSHAFLLAVAAAASMSSQGALVAGVFFTSPNLRAHAAAAILPWPCRSFARDRRGSTAVLLEDALPDDDQDDDDGEGSAAGRRMVEMEQVDHGNQSAGGGSTSSDEDGDDDGHHLWGALGRVGGGA